MGISSKERSGTTAGPDQAGGEYRFRERSTARDHSTAESPADDFNVGFRRSGLDSSSPPENEDLAADHPRNIGSGFGRFISRVDSGNSAGLLPPDTPL